MVQKRTINVLILSIGFMLVFMSFQTMSNILETIISSIKEGDPTYKADAMTSLCIVYIVLAVSNFFAPPIIRLLGTRFSIIIGALTYTTYIASFMMPQEWVLYVVSGVLGFGAAVIWTAQGKYLTENSDNFTIARNAGMFWGIFQCSQLLGNLFVFFVFQKSGSAHDAKIIDQEKRQMIYITLTALSGVGIVFLILLRKASTSEGQPVPEGEPGSSAIGSAFRLFLHGRILLLCFSFWFTGALLSFAGSVYGNCIGFTLNIAPNPKPLVGLSGVCLALGEVVGGTLFGILGEKTVFWGRNPVILLGTVIFGSSFGLIYANIPNNAPFGNTYSMSIFKPPNAHLALGCSFLLGLGDSCFNTQIYSIIGTLYHTDSAPAFAVFKFVQSVATGLGFVYTKPIGLHYLLIVLGILLAVATPSFMMVERIAAKVHQELLAAQSSATTSPSSSDDSKED